MKTNEKKTIWKYLLGFHDARVYIFPAAVLAADTFQLASHQCMVIQRGDFSGQSIALINH